MNTILICNFILLLTLMSTESKMTFNDVYESFMKLEHDHEEMCLKEHNLSEAFIDNIAKSGVFPDDRNFKCFLNCMLLKSKSINENGELILDTIKEQNKAMHLTFLEKYMNECMSKITETDPCERAAFIDKCFTEEINLALKEQDK